MLSVDPFEPSPHCKLFACGRNYQRSNFNCKSRNKPCRTNIMFAMIGEVLKIPPIDVHNVDFKVPFPIRVKDNPFTIGRPLGKRVILSIFSEFLLIPPIDVHNVDFKVFKVPLPIRSKSNPFAVGRP